MAAYNSTPVVYNGNGIFSITTINSILYGITGQSPCSGFLQIFDSATTAVVGTTTPVMTLPIKGNVPFDFKFVEGVAFTNTSKTIQMAATLHAVNDPSLMKTPITATVRYA